MRKSVIARTKKETKLLRIKQAGLNAAFFAPLYLITALVFYYAMTKDYMTLDNFSLVRLLILLLFMPIIMKYIFHLLIVPWYPAVESYRSRKRTGEYAPAVTVLIPAWNEEVGIRAAITSVLNTKYPNLEIIVVNDGSTDDTDGVITTYIKQYRREHGASAIPIRCKRIVNSGKARALNHALALACGEIIITIDADSLMDSHAIESMVKHFTNPHVASVAGNVVIGNRKNLIGCIQQLEYMYGFYFKRADSLMNAVYIVGGAAAAYRRKIIVELGGFDEKAITEDIELSTRLLSHGYQVRYAADAIVYTEGPSDFNGLCSQRLRWKFGRLLTFYKYRRLFFSISRKHNKYLTFIILPIALFAEILLLFEGLLLIIFYGYTLYTNDYLPLAFVIAILTGIICVQIITDQNTRYHRNLFWLAPVAWSVFYFMDLVEYQALLRSIRYIAKKEKCQWQKWARVGISVDTQKRG